uniref:Cadherin-20 n=1 Tax=Labrus bergylta TaxID=56723 RepID=A0A3Q3FU45_9LABR
MIKVELFKAFSSYVTLKGLFTVQPLNFESKPSYTLKVEGDVTIVHVSVEDEDVVEPQLFDLEAYIIELPEAAEIGTVLKTVSARDPDAANNTVTSCGRSSDPDKFFYIDITSGSLMTVRSLDREELGWHNITVLAMEMNDRTKVASVPVAVRVLDVNDNPPSLMHYLEAYVCENAKAGQLIQTVTALDPDEPLGGQHFYYSLAPEAANNPNFTLRDNQSWILSRRGGWSQQDQTVFYLPIFISEGEQPVQTSTSTLTIRVCSCDQEGNVMSCKAEAYSLPASLSRGALIAILACIFVLLVMILLMLSLRTHGKKPYLCDEEQNVHDDDEGGCEEDTEAFDIGAMWNRCAYDSLQTYAYEGEGSVAQLYDYLNDWGPRFKKLAEMYSVLETNSPPMW